MMKETEMPAWYSANKIELYVAKSIIEAGLAYADALAIARVAMQAYDEVLPPVTDRSQATSTDDRTS